MKQIPLSKGKAFALVDDEDYEELMKRVWYVKVTKTNKYAKACVKNEQGKWTGMYMHRLLKNNPEGLQVDHKDRNGLNNQKYNLRVATGRQNNCNIVRTVKVKNYRGVFYDDKRKGYLAVIKVFGKNYSKCYFATDKEAARYYDAMAVKYQGEFAVLNFPAEPLVDIESDRNTKGETSNLSKLNTEQVLQIRRDYKNGNSIKDIHKGYPTVTVSNIKAIVKRKSWQHLPEEE